jgi:ferredoxin
VAELTGKTAEKVEPRVAMVRCAGTHGQAVKAHDYHGIEDCLAANLLFGGPKTCKYGCLGFGTCVKSCPFGALSMNPDGLPVVNRQKCTGCGKCQQVCPKAVIAMVPIGAHVRVNCNSKDRGAVARKACSVACIGCSLCKRACPYDAITMENNLAVVDSSICLSKCSEAICLKDCPTKAIRPLVEA